MIQKIITMPRAGVLKMIEGKAVYENIQPLWALISIFNDHDILSDLKNREILKSLDCLDFQSFRFADITDTMELTPVLKEKCNLFSEDHAKSIIGFIEKIRYAVNTLVINCAARISRSGAVGLFVCRYLGMDEKAFFDANHPIPNMFILSVLNKVSGLNADYVEFWEKQIENDARFSAVTRARNIF